MNLRKISLIVSFIGILILLFLSQAINPKSVDSYDGLELGKRVRTEGTIIEIRTFDDFSIIKLDNNITINCNCIFKQNQTIRVEGKTIKYNSQLQIQAERIQRTG